MKDIYSHKNFFRDNDEGLLSLSVKNFPSITKINFSTSNKTVVY